MCDLGEPDEAIDGPDSGYDIVVDDETVEGELLNNQYGHDNPQIHQVQHIAHVQNLQQFSPAYPVGAVYHPNVHNHGQGVYFKQNNQPVVKSAINITEVESKTTEIKPIESKIVDIRTEQTAKITSTEKTEQPMKLEKAEPTTLPAPISKILGVDVAAKDKNWTQSSQAIRILNDRFCAQRWAIF